MSTATYPRRAEVRLPSDREDFRAQLEALHNEYEDRGLIGSVKVETHYGRDGERTVKITAEQVHRLK